MTLNGRK